MHQGGNLRNLAELVAVCLLRVLPCFVDRAQLYISRHTLLPSFLHRPPLSVLLLITLSACASSRTRHCGGQELQNRANAGGMLADPAGSLRDDLCARSGGWPLVGCLIDYVNHSMECGASVFVAPEQHRWGMTDSS